MFDIHPVISELDESNHPEVVTADIDYPPLIPVLEIVQRRENLTQVLRGIEGAPSQCGVCIYQGFPVVGVFSRRIIERFP